MSDEKEKPVVEPTAKESVRNFLAELPDRTEQIYWAAEEVLRDLASDASGSWDGARLVKLNPNEALILRLAGIVMGDEVEASRNVQRQVGRVRVELEQRRIYKGQAALKEAQNLARETAQREEAESEALRAQIREAEAKLKALGDATRAAKANADAMMRAKEKLAEVVPPFLQEQFEAARGIAMRSDAKKRLNELEARQHAIDDQLRRIREWEEADEYNKRNPNRQSRLDAKPELTHDQKRDQVQLPTQLAEARRTMDEQLRGATQLINAFVEHGYRGPVA